MTPVRSPVVTAFFDADTFTVSYVVADAQTSHCAVIDPVLDFDPKSGRTSTGSADKILDFIRCQGLTVEWVIDTHIHADHLSALAYIRDGRGGQTAIGSHVGVVQETFKSVFNAGAEFIPDGRQFDHRFADGDVFRIGMIEARALHTPGHTPACMSYVIGDAVFIGDTLFMPDYGSARCDFPGGDARVLYASVKRLLSLPPETRMFVGHDYAPDGREYRWETTVAEQRALNIHMKDGTDEDAFVAMRTARDASLDMPRLILPSVQVNMRAGAFPPPDENGISYLKLPLNQF